MHLNYSYLGNSSYLNITSPLVLQTHSYETKRSENNRLEPSVDLRIRLKTGTKILKGIQGILSGFQGKVATSYPEPELRQKSWERLFKSIFSDLKELQSKITPETAIKENHVPELKKLQSQSEILLSSLEDTISKTLSMYEKDPTHAFPLLPTDLQSSIDTLQEIRGKEVMRKSAERIIKLKEKIDFFGKIPDCESPEVKRFAAYVSELIPDFMVYAAINMKGAKNEIALAKCTELRDLWANINCNMNQIDFSLEKLSIFSAVLSDLRFNSLLLKKNLESIAQMHEVMNSIHTDKFSMNLAMDKKSKNKRDIAPNFAIYKQALTDLEKFGSLNVGKDISILQRYKKTNHYIVNNQISAIGRSINNLKQIKPNNINDEKLDCKIAKQRDLHIKKLVELHDRIITDWNNFCFNLAQAEFQFNIFNLTINHVAAITDSYLEADNIMQEMRFTRLKSLTRSEHLQAHQLHSNTYEAMRNSVTKDAIKQHFKGEKRTNFLSGFKPDLILQVDALMLDEEIAKLKTPEKPQAATKDLEVDADREDLIKFGFIWDSDHTKIKLLAQFKNLRTTSAELLSNIQNKINTAVTITLPDVFAVAARELNRVSAELEKTNHAEMDYYDNCFNTVYTRENQLAASVQNMATSGYIAMKGIFSGHQANVREQHTHIETLPIL